MDSTCGMVGNVWCRSLSACLFCFTAWTTLWQQQVLREGVGLVCLLLSQAKWLPTTPDANFPLPQVLQVPVVQGGSLSPAVAHKVAVQWTVSATPASTLPLPQVLQTSTPPLL